MRKRRPQGEEASAPWPAALYRASVPLQARLAEIADLLGNPFDRTLLEIGSDHGATAWHLRRLGGNWENADPDAASTASLQELAGDRALHIPGPDLPYGDATFEVVVISGGLERVADDSRLIAECHRVLKPLGRLIVAVPGIKRLSLPRGLGRLLGLTAERLGRVRLGYTESQLFDLLKDGFDVELARTCNRFFVELLEAVAQWGARKGADEAGWGASSLRWYGALRYPFKLAVALDTLLAFTRGYDLIARARRRPWRPRRAPILSDGRSIAEAALGGKIGTAAPF